MNEQVFKHLIAELNKQAKGKLSKEVIENTPQRVLNAYEELLCGYDVNIGELFKTFESEGYTGMVIANDIHFHSLCQHHLLPIYGVCHVGYLTEDKVIGVSKLTRIVETFAHRLQIQEQLTREIADCLYDSPLKPKGVMVIINARHMCMEMRGAKNSAEITTSEVRGEFLKSPSLKDEFIRLVELRK